VPAGGGNFANILKVLWCRGTESNCRHQPFQGYGFMPQPDPIIFKTPCKTIVLANLTLVSYGELSFLCGSECGSMKEG